MQPTVAVKNALQEGRPMPRNPLALYRGYAVTLQWSTWLSNDCLTVGCQLPPAPSTLWSELIVHALCVLLHPSFMHPYCGLLSTRCCCAKQINAASIAPITAVQFGANRFYEQIVKSVTGVQVALPPAMRLAWLLSWK